ncbi:MAG: peptidoglycan DD-metalloendopeptidase family protein [Halioglobus sp.]|nr:peptidoglycan DD-metalloendopeptidase family protein [Halioglobus sp.]
MLTGIGLGALVGLMYVIAPDGKHDTVDRTAADNAPESGAEAVTNVAAVALPAESDAAPHPPSAAVWTEQSVRSGDNLSLIFKRAGFSDRDLHEVISQSGDGGSLARIFPGQIFAFQADDEGELLAVRHIRSPLESVTYRRGEGGFEQEVEKREPEVREAWTTGVIQSSLFMAGQDAGLSHNLIMQLAEVFGGVIDFVLDPRKGDSIHVIYEDLYIDGEKLADGEIIAASFINQGETFNAYRYTDSQGEVGYYNKEGVSMRKAFLMAPVDFTRISSNFNLRRLHPIYKVARPHRGTDYAAPRGTPVYAAGDGHVMETGYTRANGNYVFIKHGERYITKYLHLNKRKVKRGQRVSQSEVIGTVGSTGAATGPHLHYEFLVNGVHRNPRTIHKKLPKAKSLAADELERFRESIDKVATQLAGLHSDNRVAMSESVGADSSAP